MDLAYDAGISEVSGILHISVMMALTILFFLSLPLSVQSDRKKIAVLDWLFYEEVHRDEALRQSNALIREFLGNHTSYPHT